MLAIVANSDNHQFPLRHLLNKTFVSDILYISINDIKFIPSKIRR